MGQGSQQRPPDFSAEYGSAGAAGAPTLSPQASPARGIVLGDFEIGAPVGEGGFATVHEGRQISTGRKVAIKILHDGMPPDHVGRFQKEAGYLARFNHPNIVSVLGYGQERWTASPAEEGEEPWRAQFRQSAPVKAFIALEWIEGRTLEQVYREGRESAAARPSARTLADWFAQAAGALAAVHAMGLIHRDVKPSNIMVTRDGVVKLMDFGIARLQAESRTLVTATGRVCGTLAYMSPEQLRAIDSEALIGPATDVYSLCATFYELFTSRRLLDHDTQGAVTLQTLKLSGAAPQRPRALVRGLPWEIETILMAGLESEVPDRYRSMDALEQDLRRFLADEPIRYRRPGLGRRMKLGYRRHRTVANLLAVFAVALAAGVVIYIRSMQREQARTIEQRDLARRSAQESTARLAASYEEQGRQELLAGNAARAAVYLSEAYARGRAGSPTRFMLAQALRGMSERAAAPQGHTRGVYTAEYSPDESKVVTAGRDGLIKVWDATSGAVLLTLELSPSNEASGAVFSPDGKRIVAVDDGAHGAVWDAQTGQRLFALDGHRGKVYTPRYSPDGRLIVTSSEDGTARVWDAATGKALHVLRHEGAVYCGFFSGDGTRIVTGSEDRTARIWDAATGAQIGHALAATERVTRAVFSADGTKVLVTCASPITSTLIFDGATQRRIAHFGGHTDVVRRGVFSPDGTKVVTSSKDATARLWTWYADDAQVEKHGRTEAGTTLADSVILKHGGQVFSAAFSHDGRRVGTASRDRTVKIWDTASGGFATQLTGHVGYVYQLVFTRDDRRILTASEDKTARIWDAASGRLLLTLDGKSANQSPAPDALIASLPQGAYVNLASFSRDGRYLLAVSDSAVVWDVSSRREVFGVNSMPGRATAAAFSADSRRIVVADDRQTVAVCAIDSRELVTARLGADAARLTWTCFSGDGSRVLVAGTGGAWVLDAASLKTVATLAHAPGKDVLHAEFSADGRWVVAAGADGSAKMFDAATGAAKAMLAHEGDVTWATFSPDGRRVLTASRDATAVLWDAATGAKLFTLRQGQSDYVLMAAFSRDGRRVVTAGRDYTAKVWDAATGSRVASLEGHDGLLTCAQFSPDGELVVTASEDGRAIVWDAASGKQLAALAHLSDVRWAEFSPDGSMIATASEDRSARLWQARLETRTPAEVAEFVRKAAPWRLEGERLVPR